MPLQQHKEPAISASKEQLSSPSGMKVQHKESDVSASKEQICSTSGSKDLLGQCRHEIGRRTSQDGICSSVGTTNVDQGLSFGPGKELSCSTSGRNESITLDDNRITSGFSSSITPRENKMQKIDLYTKTLIHNLVPLALPSELFNIVDDDEWLFGKKHSDGVEERRFKASGDVSCCGSSAVGPNAQYLAEAEIYALPYAVPF